LANAPGIAWQRITVFFTDERCVAPDHQASNYRMAREALLDRVAATVRRIEGERPPAEAARAYAEVLGVQPLDVIVLGMGEDGHVASLFPDTPGLATTSERVIASRSPHPPSDRVSLTMSVINQAGAVVLWIAGTQKADCVAEVLGQIESGARTLPAALVEPAGELVWLLDAGAAARLEARSGGVRAD
jgi:6-phosphogluconolactonase